jgi:lipopolysaccharide transport system permease protein
MPDTLIIEPGMAERQYWRGIWRYRDLFLVLAWRDVVLRYTQTVIGLAWVFIQPLLPMPEFTTVLTLNLSPLTLNP